MTQIEVRYIRPATAGVWVDRHGAAEDRDRLFPPHPTATHGPMTVVIDLSDVQPTPGVLQEYVLTPAQRIHGRFYGDVKLVVASRDEALVEMLGAWAEARQLPMFVSLVTSHPHAPEPKGPLTPTDRATLEALLAAGGRVSAAALADSADLEPTAASNRLSNLEKKGYVFRLTRPGREGDEFVDPRAPSPNQVVTAMIESLASVLDASAQRQTEALLRQTLTDQDEDGEQVY